MFAIFNIQLLGGVNFIINTENKSEDTSPKYYFTIMKSGLWNQVHAPLQFPCAQLLEVLSSVVQNRINAIIMMMSWFSLCFNIPWFLMIKMLCLCVAGISIQINREISPGDLVCKTKWFQEQQKRGFETKHTFVEIILLSQHTKIKRGSAHTANES